MDVDDYIKEANRQLADTNFYKVTWWPNICECENN